MEKQIQETAGVQLAKRMLESKRQTQRDALNAYQTNPKVKQFVQELIERNEQRGTPIVP